MRADPPNYSLPNYSLPNYSLPNYSLLNYSLRIFVRLKDSDDLGVIESIISELGCQEVDVIGEGDIVITDAAVDGAAPTAVIVRIGGRDDLAKLGHEACDDFWLCPLTANLVRIRLNRQRAILQHQQQMTEQEGRMESLVLNIPGIIYRCRFDEGWTMEFINEAVQEFTGFPAQDYLDGTRDYGDSIVLEDRERVTQEVADALNEDRPFSLEYRVETPAGVSRWVNSRGRGLRDSEGRLRFLDGAIFDISKEKAIAEEMYAQKDALEKLNGELRTLDDAKTRMFQNVSHEIRTPLTLILSPLLGLMEKIDDPALLKRLGTMERNALRLLDQINALLDLAKMDATGVAVNSRPLTIANILESISADVKPAAEERGILFNFAYQGPKQRERYRLDPHHIERIILNVLSNALKFTPRDGAITILVSAEEHRLLIDITDTGRGIPADMLSKIFERFEQSDTEEDTTVGGTGIGLTLVRELCERMGGSVRVVSSLGKGSTFSIEFPSSLRCGPTEAEESEFVFKKNQGGLVELSRRARFSALGGMAASQEVLRLGEGPITVLLAEDHPALRIEIAEILASHYTVVAVPDGQVALEQIKTINPMIIVSDVSMPRVSGIELCRRIRELPEYSQTGIILLSAHAGVEDRIRGRRIGVDSYLTKPFHPDELLAAVEGILRSRMRLVGDYAVHSLLGKGGQGSVFLGQNVRTEKFVALKLQAGRSLSNTKIRDRILVERDLLKTLEHPNIVKVIDHGRELDTFFMAMEYVNGVTVKDIISETGPLTAGEAVTIMLGVCEGLACAHEHDIIHHDIKCENIMVCREGPRDRSAVRILDFGVSEKLGETSGVLHGTPGYQAPEAKDGIVSEKSDVFSCAVSFYRTLTGDAPPKDDLGSMPLEASLKAVLQNALEKIPENRSSLAQLYSDLSSLGFADALPPLAEPRVHVSDLVNTARI